MSGIMECKRGYLGQARGKLEKMRKTTGASKPYVLQLVLFILQVFLIVLFWLSLDRREERGGES
jgi:hypothetical protein